MHRTSLTVHPDDNVATLFDGRDGLSSHGDGAPCAEGVPFGHKIALHSVRTGDPIIKYGIVIGHATSDIEPGDHVHVHNVR